MRAPVRSAAVLLVVAACGPNPLFMFAGESDGGSGSGGTADMSTGDEASGAPEPELPCKPVPIMPQVDECGPTKLPFPPPFPPPNIATYTMFDGVACGEASNFLVRRVNEDEIHLCLNGCEGGCEETRALPLGILNQIPFISERLPQPDECARLWHVGSLDEKNVCASRAYALWDDAGDQALRLAVTLGEIDTFSSRGVLTDIQVTLGAVTLCTGDMGVCDRNAWTLDVELDGCQFDASQNAEWRDVPYKGRDYVFSSRSSTCIGEADSFGWYLRRE